jgi:RNA polymerase sigma-70 factor (ECF subfamily)
VVTTPADAVGPPTEVLTRERPRLLGLAYRITGSRVDAEDIVQEAWLRARRVDWSEVDRPEAWLTTVVSRLALDELKSARRRRELYVGPWLPEPVRTPGGVGVSVTGSPDRPPESGTSAVPGASSDGDPAATVELAETLTFGFLRLLERLTPVERVVFLLADVFDAPFDQVAAAVDRNPATCRQIASRARRRMREGRPRQDPPEDVARVARDLLVAMGAGDVDRVVSLLAEDVVLLSDGGPDARAARRPVTGPERVARLLVNVTQRYQPWVEVEVASINREPGIVVRLSGRLWLAQSLHVVDGAVAAIHLVLNPDKLAALELSTPIT